MSDRQQDDSPWADPAVKAALDSGRLPADIALSSCPACGCFGYYNLGSHFTCRHCNRSWRVLSENEDPAEFEGPTMYAEELITLADFEDGAPEGYGH